MWNSGGKTGWSMGQGRTGTVSDPLAIFSPTQTQEAQELAKMGLRTGEAAEKDISKLNFQDYINKIWGGATGLETGEAGERNLWDVQSRRLLESLRPGLAARGLLTSGRGIDIESQKLGELGAEFTSRAFERNLERQKLLQAAAQGISILMALPINLRNQLIAAITGAQATGTVASPLTQYGGGGGIAAMFGGGGGGGG